MNVWVLLLRGINVGGHNSLPMAELRALLARLGPRHVKTLIQSGNIVFSGVIDARSFGEIVEDEIEAHYGFRPRATVFSVETFTDILHAYPWPEAFDEPKSGHIWFLAERPTAPALKKLAALCAPTERFELDTWAFYLHAPEGIGRSKLAEKVERLLGVDATARNLNTATKLAALADRLAQS